MMNVIMPKWSRIFIIITIPLLLCLYLKFSLYKQLNLELAQRYRFQINENLFKKTWFIFRKTPLSLLTKSKDELLRNIIKGTTSTLTTRDIITDLHKLEQSSEPGLRHDLKVEAELKEALKLDKGGGCVVPESDPFASEIMAFDSSQPDIICQGISWVKCYLSECRLVSKILDTLTNISCTYYDIIYKNDSYYYMGKPTTVRGDDTYKLTRSDHVQINCTGINNTVPDEMVTDRMANNVMSNDTAKYGNKNESMLTWVGHSLGFRSSVERIPSPPGREDSVNVLIFGFDSASRNGFIRKMPKSYEFLENHFEGTILKGYNILGDGTKATLIPILTGNSLAELPNIRKTKNNTRTLDDKFLLFSKLKKDGYRTAYFEDMPWAGTFQYTLNGFSKQPADHYLRAFRQNELFVSKRRSQYAKPQYFCVGDTPQYQMMINITEQFFKLDGKKFAFTFIADISHDNFNRISTADNSTVEFLSGLKRDGHLENTLLIVMGDHGFRFGKVRNTNQGLIEERLPFMFIRIPEKMKIKRPEVEVAVEINADVLTTPHDIHATILDALDLTEYYNDYKVPGANLKRGLSLLKPIPKNRSCSEAGVRAHWCICVTWKYLNPNEKLYRNIAVFLVQYINQLTEPMRDYCEFRTLTFIEWVKQKIVYGKSTEHYIVKITAGPAAAMFEAPLTYNKTSHKFEVDAMEISRTNAYGNEPACLRDVAPHLSKFCYCKQTLL